MLRAAQLARLIRAATAAPTHLPVRFLHPHLVSFSLLAALATLGRRGVVRGIDAIVDVGANIGQFAFMASRIWPRVPIYSFEPDPALFAQLENTFARFAIRGRCFPYAAADTTGERQLFQYYQHTANSLLPRSDGLKEAGRCSVTAVTLDEMRPEFDGAKCLYLKIDVQGGEVAALEGARELLGAAGFVQVEVSVESTYYSGSEPSDVMRILDASGFRLVEVLDELRSRQTGVLLEMDWLFARRSSETSATR